MYTRLFRLLLIMLLVLTGVTVSAQDDQPTMVVIPGTIQSVLGCEGDWQPDCEATALTYDPDDDLWQATFDLPAGEYEYKVALDGSWDVNYGLNAEPGGVNIPLVLEEDTSVKFIYSHDTHWVTDSVNSLIASVPGSYQDEIGCPGEWQPDCLRSLLQDPDGDGIYVFSTGAIPAGSYEAKVAINESWAVNYGDGGAPGGANIPFVVEEDGTLVDFSFDSSTNIMTIIIGGEVPPAVGNVNQAMAHWVSADTIAWDISRIPGAKYTLHYSPTGDLTLTDTGIEGGETVPLTVDREGLSEEVLAQFPHLADYVALKLDAESLDLIPEILRGRIAVSASYNQDVLQDATGVQIPGVLDDLYATDAPLGVHFNEGVPMISVWAPTAQGIRLHVFDNADPATEATVYDMDYDEDTGVWSVTGESDWYGKYYLFEVTVYAPTTQQIETNLVTDPYSVSLSMNSTRSQIIDLSDPALMPEGWNELTKPPLEAPEDITLYELHVRDFSIIDQSVPENLRGTFAAFAVDGSSGITHLESLAEAGLTHVHLLPSFDIATINENAAERQEPDRAALEALPPDAEEQQAIVMALEAVDGFNWGYDPLHYTVPEGSYSTDPNGTQRILEFRQMVQALNQAGLRVVMDVVYNHTNASGQNPNSVLDRIVPGYYHRLNNAGRVETSTCCQNTATEHLMMERLMLDSLETWATAYKVDGFRFDLMGHHTLENMVHVREMLDALTLEENGIDGARVYVYGEGWDFGEVAGNARGVNATQLNIGGVGIGVFNDRLRDAARGGNPFGGLTEQGFTTGLFVDPNSVDTRTPEEQRETALLFADQIRVGLAGNLRDYTFIDRTGAESTGADILYNGLPAGYTLDPQENIIYVEAHDNETFFDVMMAKAPADMPVETRIRLHNMGMSLVALSQGVPFFHAGQDILRSKSGDRNSYNSGDWYNALDWTYADNNWGHGLPPAPDNRDTWEIWRPLLGNEALMPSTEHIRSANHHLREMLEVRYSSPLFRLQTAEQVQTALRFHNTGEDQVPGVIVMHLDDSELQIDPNYSDIVVVFNATPDEISYRIDGAATADYELHPIQFASNDAAVRLASVDRETGTFTVPAYTTAVFVAFDSE